MNTWSPDTLRTFRKWGLTGKSGLLGPGLMAYNHGNIPNHSNPRYTVPNSKHAPEHREGSTVRPHRHQAFHTSRKSVETRTADHWMCIMFYMPNCPVSYSNSFSSAISTSLSSCFLSPQRCEQTTAAHPHRHDGLTVSSNWEPERAHPPLSCFLSGVWS